MNTSVAVDRPLNTPLVAPFAMLFGPQTPL
jgi:hypothetical protein